MSTTSLWIPLPTPSQNQWDKWHWAQQEKWKKAMMLMVRSAVVKAGGRKNLPRACANRKDNEGVPVQLRLVRRGHNLLDHGNLVGGAKGLLDVLRLEGVIVDDSPRWLADRYEQTVTRQRDEQGTLLELVWDEPGELPEKEEKGVVVFNFDKQSVELRKVEITKAYQDDQGKSLLYVRVHLTAQEMSWQDVPFVSSAIASLAKESADVEEGPNSYSVSIKRDFGLTRFSLSEQGSKSVPVTFSGLPVNQVKVQVVECVVALRWCIEDVAMTPDTLKKLAGKVGCEGLVIKATPAQQSLPFETGAAVH